MLYFYKKTGEYINTEQWDGTIDDAARIARELGILIVRNRARLKNTLKSTLIVAGHFIFVTDEKIQCWKPEVFRNTYAPFTEARKRLIDGAIPFVRDELSKKIDKGDDWLKKCPYDLWRQLTEETSMIGQEIDKIALAKEPFLEAAIAKSAHVIICAMMIIDKLQAIKAEKELEAMWNSRSKSES